jgi:hypothetical protein
MTPRFLFDCRNTTGLVHKHPRVAHPWHSGIECCGDTWRE